MRKSATPIASEEEVGEKAVAALRDALGDRLVAVVLFGSRARGDAKPESDWDLLVIARELLDNPFDRQMALRQALSLRQPGPISILPRTPEEFEHHLPALFLDIAVDGRILYDPEGYATARLAMIKRIIEGTGLYRLRTPAGDIWRWKQEPRGRWTLDWNGVK